MSIYLSSNTIKVKYGKIPKERVFGQPHFYLKRNIEYTMLFKKRSQTKVR